MPTLALISWPMVTLILFAALGPARGLIWAVVVGYLFLPENFGFDIPGLPPYDKKTAISFSLLLPAMLYWGKVDPVRANAPMVRVFILSCIAVMILGSVGTYLQNTNTLINAHIVRSGLSARDVISMASDTVLITLPMLLAWHFLRRPEDHRDLLVAVVIMGLVYTLLALFELRMSPRLAKWVYGYFPHDWRQHLRGGGYRPVAFLEHGLSLGFFLFSAAVAGLALGRDKSKPNGVLYLFAGLWCFLILSISRNLGATLLAVIFIPAVLILGFRAQVRVGAVLAAMLLSYPVLSTVTLGPATRGLELLESVAPERAQSFQFRLDNEHMLMDRAMEKPAFGWGGFSRQRVFDERGRDQTVTDGLWIITLGQGGWVKYLAFFGILCGPLLFLRRAARRKKISAPIAGMALIMGGNFVYMIPNSTLSPVAFIMLGAMAAFIQFDTAKEDTPAPVEPGSDRPRSRYSRFAHSHTAPGADEMPSRRLTRPALGQGGRT